MIWQSVNRKRKRKKSLKPADGTHHPYVINSVLLGLLSFVNFMMSMACIDIYVMLWQVEYILMLLDRKENEVDIAQKKFVFRHWFFFSSPDDLNSFICFLHIWTVILPVLFSPFVLLKDTCPLMAASSGGLWEV